MKISFYLNKLNAKIPGWAKTVFTFIVAYISTKVLDDLPLSTVLAYNPFKYIGRQSFESSFFNPLILIFFLTIFIFSFIFNLIIKKYFYSILLLIAALFYIAVAPSTFAQRTAVNYYKLTSSNIEIIHPFISDKEYSEMKSELNQVDSKQQFYDLNNKIKNIAKSSKTKIYSYIND